MALVLRSRWQWTLPGMDGQSWRADCAAWLSTAETVSADRGAGGPSGRLWNNGLVAGRGAAPGWRAGRWTRRGPTGLAARGSTPGVVPIATRMTRRASDR